jgi:hypothetical protein
MPSQPAGSVCHVSVPFSRRHAATAPTTRSWKRRHCPTPRGEAIERAHAHRVAAAQGAALSPSAPEWVARVLDTAELLNLRADGSRNLYAVATCLAQLSDPASMSVRPLHERLTRLTGLHLSAVKRWLAWLHRQSLLVTFEHGSIPEWRRFHAPYPDVPDAEDPKRNGRRAAVYLLTGPAAGAPAPSLAPLFGDSVDENEPPLPSVVEVREEPLRARGTHDRQSPLRGPESFPRTKKPAKGGHGTPPRPGTPRAGLHQAALAVRRDTLAFRRLSVAHVASLIRPFICQGWTCSDVLWALERDPRGVPHPGHTSPHSPAGWAKYRLGRWTSAHGEILPSQSSVLAERAQAHAQARRAASEQRRLTEDQAADPHSPAVRAMLRDVRQALRALPRELPDREPWLPTLLGRASNASPAPEVCDE